MPKNESDLAVAEEAIDTLAHLLRTLGQHGFDTAKVKAADAESDLEAWARHILVGAAPPGRTSEASTGDTRDWKGLCRYATDKRRDEADYVVSSLSDLREVLWTFIQGLARAVPAEQGSNQIITRQLEKLRSCLASNDTRELRRVASASIESIDAEIRDRIVRSTGQIEELADQVKQVANELMDARAHFERDPLTGLYSRIGFDEYFSKMTHLGTISGQPSTLFLIDIDDFKWVNDRAGKAVSDAVLREVAKCLRAGFARRSDFVARFGGDEFGVLVQTEDASTDRELAEGALHRVRDLSVPDGEEAIRVTLSIGVARLRCGERANEWLERAECALHQAKESGRDRVVSEPE